MLWLTYMCQVFWKGTEILVNWGDCPHIQEVKQDGTLQLTECFLR